MNLDFLKTFPFLSSREYWGAEFLEQEVRLVQVRVKSGKPSVARSFHGSYEDARKFAAGHFLRFKGVNAAISHLPIKLNGLEGMVRGDSDELEAEENRLRPVGIKAEEMRVHVISPVSAAASGAGGGWVMLQIREEQLSQFIEGLPEELNVLSAVTSTPLAMHFLAAQRAGSEECAVVGLEEDFTHILLYNQGRFCEGVKIHYGLNHYLASREVYIAELKKVLVYYWQSRQMEASFKRVLFLQWKGDDEQLGSFTTDVQAATGIKTDLVGAAGLLAAGGAERVFPFMRTAAFMALEGFRKDREGSPVESSLFFSNSRSDIPESRDRWLRRSQVLFKFSFILLCTAILALGGLFCGSAVFGALNRMDGRAQTEDIAELSLVREKSRAAEEAVRRVHQVMRERSRVSAAVKALAESLPDNLWLRQWDFSISADGKNVHDISGFAFTESEVTRFLSELEKRSEFSSVMLRSTELVPGESVQRQTGLKSNKRDLTFFKVSLKE